MPTGILIPHDLSRRPQLRDFDELPEYMEAVGGWLGDFDLPSRGLVLFVNEYGRAAKLPLNIRATHLLWAAAPEYEDKEVIVCGNAVLLGHREGSRYPSVVLPMMAPEIVRSYA